MRLAHTAVLLLSFVSTGFAQDSLQFVHPEAGTEVALDTYQDVSVRWLRGDRPVVGGTVGLRTDLGTIEVERAFTDSRGIAAFSIISSREGRATLRASTAADERAEAQLELRFSASAEPGPPYGSLAGERRLPGQLPLWVFQDRVGLLAPGHVDIADIARIAKAERLVQLTPLGESLFVLKVPLLPEAQDADLFLRDLARRLERDHPEVFRAGRVARIAKTSQWLVLPDQVIVKFASGVSEPVIEDILRELSPDRVEQAPLDPLRYVVTLRPGGADALQTAYELAQKGGTVAYAEPNYLIAIELRDPTTDTGFSFQWHHENDGAYGTEDADMDSAGAWTYGAGGENVTIAVIDRGFDINHPDLVENLECDPGEWCETFGKRAINVTETDPDPTSLLSFASGAGAFAHGTEAAGVAAERGGNTIGYSGTCPHCRLMLIRNEESLNSVADAFDQAIAKNVDVISNSWGFAIGSDPNETSYTPIKTIVEKIDEAVAAGITVVFAMSNFEYDNCVAPPDISSLPNVIGVSGSTDYDMRSNIDGEAMGFGPCMDVLAPTRGGKRGIRTTSVTRISNVVTSTYWHDFSGTSAATPMVAGTVALVKNQMPELSPLQVQRILQDTADRVDPQHAAYSPETGFSETGGNSSHGYGRVNAFEAVRLVAPLSSAKNEVPRGRGGRDLVLRDHEFDWGNTERPSNVILDSPRGNYTEHRSVDIKVDASPFQAVTPDFEGFLALNPEEPRVNVPSLVYVRVRNRGPVTVQEAQLKLHHAVVTDALPDLPGGFWESFPADATGPGEWHPLPYQDLGAIGYSGASVAGCPGRVTGECLPAGATDAARVAVFELPALDWNAAAGERLALLAVVNSAEDPVEGASSPGFDKVFAAVTQDNNVTLWLSGVEVPACPQWLVFLILVLLLAAVALLLWMIWSMIGGTQVTWVLALLLVVIAVLVIIAVLAPGCFGALIGALGL